MLPRPATTRRLHRLATDHATVCPHSTRARPRSLQATWHGNVSDPAGEDLWSLPMLDGATRAQRVMFAVAWLLGHLVIVGAVRVLVGVAVAACLQNRPVPQRYVVPEDERLAAAVVADQLPGKFALLVETMHSDAGVVHR